MSLFELMMLIILIIFIVLIWGGQKWWNNTRVERKKQKFDKLRTEYEAHGRDNRDKKALKLQRKNMHEMTTLVNKLLDKHKRDIPPRLLDETKNLIQSYIDKVEFDKLYALYMVLLESNASNVYDNIRNFRM